jgi:hypothetical protein
MPVQPDIVRGMLSIIWWLSGWMMSWSPSTWFISDDIELVRLAVDTIFLRILALM